MKGLFYSATACAVLAGSQAIAQAPPPPAPSAGISDIIVTANKRAGGVNVQKVNIAVTAVDARSIEESHVRTFSDIAFKAPNAILEGTSSMKGVANFSLRGQGINSSIPSIDPTVGTFVDGVYLGINNGIVFDTFDLERVEVLRGPQGLLFGRNVTGGAVLIETTRPTATLTGTLRASLETGPNYTGSGVVSGPLTADGALRVKAGVYHNKDEGYFENRGGPVHGIGGGRTWLARGGIEYKPSSSFDTLLRYEHGDTQGDSVISQNHAIYSREASARTNSSVGFPGFIDQHWNQVTWQTDIGVDFGAGTITNIAAYRDIRQIAASDIDGLPAVLFHAYYGLTQDQRSNELRYSGTFGRVDATVGLFYYDANLTYIERRVIAPVTDISGGGKQRSSTYAGFGSFDVHATDKLTLNLGARYSHERKHARARTLQPTASGICDYAVPTCASYLFDDAHSWNAFSPKVGVQYQADRNVQLYASWARAQRSGGYNVRVSGNGRPGPFNQEKQDTYEIGVKSDLIGHTLRANAALFYNVIKGAQREVNVPDPAFGIVQTITNTADVDTRGVEIELIAKPTSILQIQATLGYVDSKYRRVLYDISGDGVVNANDLRLRLPRLSPWTWGINANLRQPTGFGALWANASFSYRDKSFSTDANTGLIKDFRNLSASVGTDLNNGLGASIYVKNALDDTNYGLDNPLPVSIGGAGSTFSPLNKGRIFGAEVTYRF